MGNTLAPPIPLPIQNNKGRSRCLSLLLVQIQSKLPLTSQRIVCINRAFPECLQRCFTIVYTKQTLKDPILSLLNQINC